MRIYVAAVLILITANTAKTQEKSSKAKLEELQKPIWDSPSKENRGTNNLWPRGNPWVKDDDPNSAYQKWERLHNLILKNLPTPATTETNPLLRRIGPATETAAQPKKTADCMTIQEGLTLKLGQPIPEHLQNKHCCCPTSEAAATPPETKSPSQSEPGENPFGDMNMRDPGSPNETDRKHPTRKNPYGNMNMTPPAADGSTPSTRIDRDRDEETDGFNPFQKTAPSTIRERITNGISESVATILYPGNAVLALGDYVPGFISNRFPLSPMAALVLAVLISWFFYLRAARLIYCIVGQKFGFANPNHYVWFTRLWLPWRWAVKKFVLPIFWWAEELLSYGHEATARPANAMETMVELYKPGSILLGTIRVKGIRLFMPVGIDGEKHLVMFAGTGAGKTTQLISMLGLHEGSALIIDPKGQMAKAMLRRMGKGGPGILGKHMKVGTLDPSEMTKDCGGIQFCWNPFLEIQYARDRAIKDGRDPEDITVAFAQKMVDGLIVSSPKTDPFWTSSAKNFVGSLVLWMDKNLPEDQRTLTNLYDLATAGLVNQVNPLDPKQTGMDMLLYRMSEERGQGAIGNAIANGASGLQNAGSKTVGSIRATFEEQMQWLKRPALQRISATSNFKIEELHDGNLAIFVTAKVTDIRDSFPGWFRVLTVMTVAVFEDIGRRPRRPCLLAIDEFANLGKLTSIETTAPLMRSFGIRLLIILQNLGQFKDAGYENPDTFTGNAEATIWMQTNHNDNLLHLQQILGKATRLEELDGPGLTSMARLSRHGRVEREVMTHDHIRRFLKRGNVIVTRDGRPLFLAAVPYFRTLPVCFYDRDPEHRENKCRNFTRNVFRKIYPNGKALPVPIITDDEPEIVSAPALQLPPPLPLPVITPMPELAPPPPRKKRTPKPKAIIAATEERGALVPNNNGKMMAAFETCFNPLNGSYPAPETRKKLYRLMLDGSDFTEMNFYGLVQTGDFAPSEQAAITEHFIKQLSA